jgi:hypothetical protein
VLSILGLVCVSLLLCFVGLRLWNFLTQSCCFFDRQHEGKRYHMAVLPLPATDSCNMSADCTAHSTKYHNGWPSISNFAREYIPMPVVLNLF